MENSVNIAFLGNCTTDYIARALKDQCKKNSLSPSIYNCPYDQYYQEILNQDSGFYRSQPELVILFLEGSLLFTAWYEFNTLLSSKGKKMSLIQHSFDVLTEIVESIHTNSSAKIIINNFKIPYHSPLGILDGKYYPGLKDMISLLNLKLTQWADSKDYVYVFDYCGLCARFGHHYVEDSKMYYIAKSPVSFQFVNRLAKEYLRFILPLKFLAKKCLVLDLDNTLWGGVAGEDGISGIKLDLSGPGQSYYDFQKEILNLYQKGIILAVNSKNNIEDAMAIIEDHPYMILRKHHFSSFRINWQDKVKNLKEIAQELNIGLDSMVFFDDNPVERELVKSMLPQVKVVDVPADPSKYKLTLQDLVEFELLKITQEDRQRNAMYAANQRRIEVRQQFQNMEDYLASLKIRVVLEYANQFTIPRIAQLTQKTNQFNMTTKRYSQNDMENMVTSDKYLVFSCQVLDKFGDNGIAGVCIVLRENASAYIDTFLLSCRVLGRNIEYAFIGKVVSLLKDRGVTTIVARYKKTEKSRANERFYAQAGFFLDSVDEEGALYSLNTLSKLKTIDYIEIVMGNEE